jgi:F1F0 ATPase subunit 2
MTEIARTSLLLVLGLLGGALLGSVFFGGLWLTVSRLTAGRGGALLVSASLVARLSVLAAGLVLAARCGPFALLSCVVGVLATRAVALRLVRVPTGYPPNAEKGPRS